MSNNTQLNTNVTAGDTIATEDIAGVKHELVKVEFGADGVATKVSATDPLPVTTDGLTDAELRATPVPVSGTVTVDTSTLATAAKQDTGNSSLSSILAKIITAPATEAKQDIGNTSLSTIAGKDFATQTTLALIKAKTDNIDVALSTRTKPADQQHVIVDSGTVTVDTTGLATSAKQDTGNTSLASIDSKLTNPLPISGTVTTGGLTDTQLRASAVPISAATLPLPTGAATLAGQTQPGVDIGDVTINNSTGASAVNIQDGGNSITVDGTVALSAGSAVIGHVITDTGSTTAVTGNVTVVQGTGTNLHAVLDASSAVIGHVIVDTAPVTHVIADSGTITTVSTVTAVTAISNALPAGNNNIGDVDIASGTITSITNNVNTVEVVGATIFNGKTSTVTAGTRVTLASSQAVKSVTIKALSTNTGLIYVGNSSVASTNGFQLSAGDSISMDIANLNTVNIDSSVSAEGVTYIAVNT